MNVPAERFVSEVIVLM